MKKILFILLAMSVVFSCQKKDIEVVNDIEAEVVFSVADKGVAKGVFVKFKSKHEFSIVTQIMERRKNK